MTRKAAVRLRNFLMLAGFLLMMLSNIWKPLLPFGLLTMLSCLIPDHLYNRCPHCKKGLGRNGGDFCPFCGQPLDD